MQAQLATRPTYIVGRPAVVCDTERSHYLVIWRRVTGAVYALYGRSVSWKSDCPALAIFPSDSTKPAQTQVYALVHASVPDELLVVWGMSDAAEIAGSYTQWL